MITDWSVAFSWSAIWNAALLIAGPIVQLVVSLVGLAVAAYVTQALIKAFRG